MTSLMNQTKRKMWKAIDKMFDQNDRDRNSVTHWQRRPTDRSRARQPCSPISLVLIQNG